MASSSWLYGASCRHPSPRVRSGEYAKRPIKWGSRPQRQGLKAAIKAAIMPRSYPLSVSPQKTPDNSVSTSWPRLPLALAYLPLSQHSSSPIAHIKESSTYRVHVLKHIEQLPQPSQRIKAYCCHSSFRILIPYLQSLFSLPLVLFLFFFSPHVLPRAPRRLWAQHAPVRA